MEDRKINSKIAVFAAFTLMATYAAAATITVNRTGTGDFATIQPALSAAADGDTILIGPGEYTERTDAWTPGGWTVDTCGWISTSSLVIIGAGADATLIGPALYEGNDATHSPSAFVCEWTTDLRLADLTIRNCHTGVNIRGSVWIDRCRFYNNKDAFAWSTAGSGGAIGSTRFDALDPDFQTVLRISTTSTDHILVDDCVFVDALPYVTGGGGIVFRGCSLTGPARYGIQVEGATACELWNCDISNVGVGILAAGPGSRCTIHNSRIEGINNALLIDQRSCAYADGSTLFGGTAAVVWARESDEIVIHGCDLQRGSGTVILCARASELGAVTYDLTNNYWGTTDEAVIQGWIFDGSDDSRIAATVMYSPFAGQSVPTQSASWGEVKALFR